MTYEKDFFSSSRRFEKERSCKEEHLVREGFLRVQTERKASREGYRSSNSIPAHLFMGMPGSVFFVLITELFLKHQ